MVACKNITKLVSVIVAAAVLACILALLFPRQVAETFGESTVSLRYETELFDTSRIMEIDIQMDEEQWADMLANAAKENYYSCDVVIGQETIHNVGIRPKGNTSLSAIVMDPDTDRFSFKLEFDHYVEGQTCLGLDKLVLNNNYADATNMKEALVYDMYGYLEADASLYNYARISVNGRYWGVYLALEAVEDSFQLRNYGTADGNLYKPEGMGMGGGPGGGKDGPPGEMPQWSREGRNRDGSGEMSQWPGEMKTDGEMMSAGEAKSDGEMVSAGEAKPDERMMPAGEIKPNGEMMPAGEIKPNGNAMPEDEMISEDEMIPEGENRRSRGGMPGRGPSMSGSGADLNYTDDDLDSYSIIWEGEVGDTGKKDHRRVVTALKNISQGKDARQYMDVDNILKYMAVHVFSVNLDSLSGVMAHNYYLYEDNGKLNILPWDYNLAFGGMGMGQDNSASGTVNDAIDTPFEATEFFDILLEDEQYLARYHEYLRQLAEDYVGGGKLEEFYNRVQSQIDGLVETDPTAFYSFEEYQAGAGMLYETVKLRAESILGQLDGTIPSTDEGQKADPSKLVDASSIDIDVMGTFSMGRGGMEEGKRNVSDHNEADAREAFGEAPVMPGQPGGSNGETMVRNLILLGSCLLVSLLALLSVKAYSRI